MVYNCKSSTHTDKTCSKSKDKAKKTYDFTDQHLKLMIIISNYHARKHF